MMQIKLKIKLNKIYFYFDHIMTIILNISLKVDTFIPFYSIPLSKNSFIIYIKSVFLSEAPQSLHKAHP